jgi:ankyrin repeat protein
MQSRSDMKTTAEPAGKKKQRRERNNDNVIFLICVVIAAVFWVLIKLSDFYTVNYPFQLSYKNIPADKQLTLLYDSSINVNFRARGITIFLLNMSKNSRNITVDLEQIQPMHQENDHYFVYTQELRDMLAELIEIPETDIDFSKTTVGFTLEDLMSKEVEVIEKHSLQFKPQYDLYEPAIITPRKITVYGPRKILDTLTKAYTEPLTLTNLDKDVAVDVKIQNKHKELLHFEPNTVNLRIRVEKFTESSVETAIDFSSIKQEIKSFPATVKVNFKLAQKDFNNISASQFQVIPETEGLDLSKADKIHLKLVRKPDFTRNEWITPTDVEFLITK